MRPRPCVAREMGADEIIGEDPGETGLRRLPRRRQRELRWRRPCLLLRRRGRLSLHLPGCRSPEVPAAPRPPTARRSARSFEALNRFDACPLKKTATRLCFADGNPQARVMLVGEAPGRDEDIRASPSWASQASCSTACWRQSACRGRRRTRECGVHHQCHLLAPAGNRTPTEAETQMCLPFLLRTIEIQKPTSSCASAPTPASRLTGRSDGILKLRGKWVTANVSGRKHSAAAHPASRLSAAAAESEAAGMA